MNNLPAVDSRPTATEIAERVLIQGDLAKLTAGERVVYYREVCRSLGLNELTKPFDYISLNGRLVLYAKRDCTDQLRSLHRVSVTISSRELVNDVYVVTARATTPDGRTEESIGAVAVTALKGESLANAYMKAETKAKRRVTLSLVGLGWLDETEVGTVPGVEYPQDRVKVNTETGEVIDAEAKPAEVNAKRRAMEDAYATLMLEAIDIGCDKGILEGLTLVDLATIPDETLKLTGRELKRLVTFRQAEIEDEKAAAADPFVKE